LPERKVLGRRGGHIQGSFVDVLNFAHHFPDRKTVLRTE
jgi:hypothetical protein